MNIVKFRDTVINGNDNFNTNYKGKYCYCVNWVWCIPLDVINEIDFVELSKNNISVDEEFREMYIPDTIDVDKRAIIENTVIYYEEYKSYDDTPVTEAANSSLRFMLANEVATTGTLTIDQLKQFRTWLATTLYNYQELYKDYKNDPQKTTMMLNYYKENMYDDVCKALDSFTNIPFIQGNLGAASCYSGCMPGVTTTAVNQPCSCGGSSVIQLGTITTGCLESYRKNVYNWMVLVFSDSDFWKLFNETTPNLINLIILYLQGILDANLPLSKQCDKITYNDCSCLAGDTNEINRGILQDAIKAFTFILNNNIAPNQTFIYNSLNKWSSTLYEIMQW